MVAAEWIQMLAHDLARERDIRAVQAQIDQPTFSEALAHGRSMSTPDVIAYSLGET